MVLLDILIILIEISSQRSQDKASIFGNLFASYGNLDDGGAPLPEFSKRTNTVLPKVKATVSDVLSHIKDLAVSKATGPDEITVIVLKNTASEIAPILLKLFNRCLSEKCFPSH